jgi:CBS domain-containing protein
VGEIALRNFIHASAETSLLEVARLMGSARIRHLLVVDGGRLSGVLSYRDVQDYAFLRNPEGGGLEVLRSARAAELMRRDPITAQPSLKLRDAARRMLAHRIGCLPIVEGEPPDARVVGMLTESDLLRAAFRLGS